MTMSSIKYRETLYTAGHLTDKILINYLVTMHPLCKYYLSQEVVLNAGVFVSAELITGLFNECVRLLCFCRCIQMIVIHITDSALFSPRKGAVSQKSHKGCSCQKTEAPG